MYADYAYYSGTYYGESGDSTLISSYLRRASEDIDFATRGQIVLADLADEQITMIKNACCAQAESYLQAGGTDEGSGNVSLGKFSISGESKSAGGYLCKRAEGLLRPAGLLNRGVCVLPTRNLDQLNSGVAITGLKDETDTSKIS